MKIEEVVNRRASGEIGYKAVLKALSDKTQVFTAKELTIICNVGWGTVKSVLDNLMRKKIAYYHQFPSHKVWGCKEAIGKLEKGVKKYEN